jgi:hypothetical protein
VGQTEVKKTVIYFFHKKSQRHKEKEKEKRRYKDRKIKESYLPKTILRLRMMETKSSKQRVPSFRMYRSMIVLKIDEFSWKPTWSRPSFRQRNRDTKRKRRRKKNIYLKSKDRKKKEKLLTKSDTEIKNDGNKVSKAKSPVFPDVPQHDRAQD